MRIIFFILISIGILFSKSVDVDIKAQSFSADKKIILYILKDKYLW